MKISLVILTYNEIVGLKAIFPRIPQEAVDEVFVVDGGSTDGTLEYLNEKGVRVYGQEKKGRGEAFRKAIRVSSCDALIFYSPDGNEDPEDIPKFKEYLEKNIDLVIATRMTKNGHNEEDDQIFKWRKWANNFFTWIANITWNKGKYVTDTINGYRAITKNAWKKINPDGDNYTIEYQSSIRAFKLGLKIEEFPTWEAVRIDDQIGSPSIKTGVEFIRLYLSELKRGNSF